MEIDDKIYEEINKRTGGFNGLVGVKIVKFGVGESVCEIEIKDDHRNPAGNVHGGVICTLLDTAAGVSAMNKGDSIRAVVTQNCDIHFLKAAKDGKLRAVGKIVKDGKNIAVSRADLYDDNDILIATGTFDLFYVPNGVMEYIQEKQE